MRCAFGLSSLLALGGCGLFSRPPPPPPARPTTLPAPAVTPGELDARAVLGDLPVRAARLGAGAPSMVKADEATEGDWVGAFVEIPKDTCLLAYARASATIEDVDMAVYADDGTQLAVDEARDVHPTVLLCGPHPPRVYVAAHVVEGEGFVVVAAQLVPRERGLIVSRALGARGSVDEAAHPVDAWPGLDETVLAHRKVLGGSWETFKRAALGVDARLPTFVAMPVEADECVDAVVVADTDVLGLDVEAVDGEGRVVTRARDGGGVRTLTLCSSTVVPASLSIRPHAGRGVVAVVLGRARGEMARDLATAPEVAWTSSTLPLESARRSRDSLLAKSGYDSPVSSSSGNLAVGRRQSVTLDLKALGGACARVDVVAGAPLGLVDARAWDDGGTLVAADEASTGLALFVCSRGVARLELETRGRPGPFAVAMRKERWKDAAFAAHPLAASRLLARAAVGPGQVLEGIPSPARSVSLDVAHPSTWTVALPAGKCSRVTAGVEGDGAGVDLRAVDAADETDLDRSEGAFAASVRVCAPEEAPRSVRLDLRASAGKLDALVAEETSAR